MTYKKGDIVQLDCGYDGMDDTRPCKILDTPREYRGLFENSPSTLSASVMIVGTGEVFTANLPRK